MALDSHNTNSVFHTLGLRGLEYGQVTTMMYFKVSVSDFLTLFSARTPDGPFYSVAPSRILMVAGAFATCLSTILASAWPDSHPDEIATIGLVR
jgi:H+-transporting ATPase